MAGSAVMDDQDYTFEAFARHGFYEKVNRDLVDVVLRLRDLSHQPLRRVLDLACGTGAVTRLVVEGLQTRGTEAEVIGLDASESALEKARRLLGSSARFVRGTAESFASKVPRVDVVLFCNAIHLLRDKEVVIAQARDVLTQDGLLAFNSAFFEGSYVAGTERFYRLWTMHAMRELRQTYPDLRVQKGRSEAMRWLSPEGYRELLEKHGFTVEYLETEIAQMTCESWQDISHYSLFADGALPGIPVEIAAPILSQTARKTFDELNLDIIPRNWLQVVARAS